MISIVALIAAGIPPTQARAFADPLLLACARFDIGTRVRQAALVAQCAYESRMFTKLEEDLFYRTPERIMKVFSVPTIAIAQTLVGKPEALANHVYAGKNGNGDEHSGDGWRYRGGGLIELTGRKNYAAASRDCGRDYVGTPKLVREPLDAALSAAWFFWANGCNPLADASNIDAITRVVNGRAMLAAAERRQLFNDICRALQP